MELNNYSRKIAKKQTKSGVGGGGELTGLDNKNLLVEKFQ
jgi:hypothetical protein